MVESRTRDHTDGEERSTERSLFEEGEMIVWRKTISRV